MALLALEGRKVPRIDIIRDNHGVWHVVGRATSAYKYREQGSKTRRGPFPFISCI